MIGGVSQSAAKINILDCDGFGLLNYFEGRNREGQYKGRDCIYIHTLTGEKVVLIAGGAKLGDEKYFKGFTLGSVYVTEANECHIKFLQEVFDRTLSSPDRKIFRDHNPKAPTHQYYTGENMLNFHEKKQKKNPSYGFNHGKFNIFDNSSISNQKLRETLNTYDKGTVHYIRDILGERIQAEGVIFTRFANCPEKYTVDSVPHLTEISVGVDFGGSSSAHAFCGTALNTNYNKIYVLKSELMPAKDTQSKDISDKCIEFVGEIIKKYGRCDYVEYDHASNILGNDLKVAVERAFPQVTVNPCLKPEIKDRIDILAKMIGEDRFFITKDCDTLRTALSECLYDPKDDTHWLDDGSTDLDSIDAMYYSFSRHLYDFIDY